MQSQIYPMAKWAIGLRLPGSTDALVEEAYNKGEILRTHVLRPTWHFVHPLDIRWMLQLTGPRVQAFNKMYYKRKELDTNIFKKSNQIIIKELQGGNHLTRTTLQTALQKRGIKAEGIRLAFLMMQAELEGIICSGRREGKQFTYALLEERVPAAKPLPRNEAMKMLTERYFKSRGPATVNDFAWWSGLTIKECKESISDLKPKMMTEAWNGHEYYFMETSFDKLKIADATFIMPDYDEYGIAYKDRSALFDKKFITPDEFKSKGYAHVLVIGGVIAGTWNIFKKNEGNNRFRVLDMSLFSKLPSSKQNALYRATDRFHAFTQYEV